MSTIMSGKDDTDAAAVLAGSTDAESKATTDTSSSAVVNGSANPEEITSQIDSALLAAMRDPRERLALLRLEQVLCDLMRSETDGWIEVGGPFNSYVLWPSETSARCGAAYPAGLRQTTFQRLILHRLADRFGIIREQGSLLQTAPGDGTMMMATMGSGAIRLIKLPQSKIPSSLLQDLDASVYEQCGDTPMSSSAAAAVEGTGSPTRPSQTNKSQKPRKMKIMKRQGSNQSQSSNYKGGSKSNGSSHSGRLSLSDKEKAYAEARARIFQDEQEGATGSAPSQQEENSNVTNELTSSVQNLAVSGEKTGVPGNNSNSNSGSRGIPYYRSSSLRSSTGSLSSAASNQSGAPQRSDSHTATSEGRKAVLRNYAEEAADPDFQRGVLRTAVATPAAAAAAHTAYGGPNPAWQQSVAGAYPPPMQPESSAQHSYAAAVPSYAPPTTSITSSWPSLGAPTTTTSTTSTASSSLQQQQQQQQSFASAVANGSSNISTSSRGGGKSLLTATAPAWTPRSSSASS